jgi:hypothetical protein
MTDSKKFLFKNYEAYVLAITKGNSLGGRYILKTENQWIAFEKAEINAQKASAHIGG